MSSEDLESAYGDGWYDGFLAAQKLVEDGEEVDEYSKDDVILLSEHAECSRPSQSRARWTELAPKEQGLYWHWSGDINEAPIVLSVLYSDTKKECFVSKGQYGLNEPVFCGEYGGFWWACVQPPLPPDNID